jgi:hypothetical protein
MPKELLAWWLLLGAVSLANIAVWTRLALAARRGAVSLDEDVRAAGRAQLWLAAGYVFGCAFRSAFPVIDVPRLCLVDSPLSTVLIGRSVATLAELCFAAQCALAIGAVAEAMGSTFARATARAVVPLIALAEVCSWHAVLTTSNLGHVAEESIWALTASLMLASVIASWPQHPRRLRIVAALACIVGAGYVGFMVLVDVPMYLSRWLADRASGHVPRTLADGLAQLAAPCVSSWRWQDWRAEVPWMTLYFSVAVWFSLLLVRVPALLPRRALGEPATGPH